MLTDKIKAIQSADLQPNILVIGDLMLDRYIWGDASRLSPEAPVPIVNIKEESTTLGGAANVIKNLVSLGATVKAAGFTGNDHMGKQLKELLDNEGIDTGGIITDPGRITTIKTRVLVGAQQLVRLDNEMNHALSQSLENELMEKVKACISDADLVVLSDYNKGTFAPELTRQIINIANLNNKKVIVDPKGLDYRKYKGAFLIKPNRKELAEAAKFENINSIETLNAASKVIFEHTAAHYLVVTLSEQGMVILSADGHKALPVKATEVFDVTGAGDTVMASIAYFLSRGLSIEESCELANYAAAIVIRHVGCTTTTLHEILKEVAAHYSCEKNNSPYL
jgi:D-beta-D-heptose 7-phosphate kinase/D-beta-D-heptose 1-phosphate adenosyltransferase